MAAVILIVVALPFPTAFAAEEERSFLVCEGVSRTDTSNTFSFTVTLDPSAGKVLDIGTGPGATTDAFTDAVIVGRQDIGNGVTNRLTINRTTQAFSLEIVHAVREADPPSDTDDVFSGRCGPTARPF